MNLLLISNSTNAGEPYLKYPIEEIAKTLKGVTEVVFIPYAAVTFSYDESEENGMQGSVTAVTYMQENPDVVSMIREGAVSATLVFEEGKRHHCIYNTPIMPFEICVKTIKVVNRLSINGSLELDYIIEIRGAKAERTKFYMQVLK